MKKNSEETRREIPSADKSHLQKNLQLTLYLRMKDQIIYLQVLNKTGCPLSPCLFNIIPEVSSKALRQDAQLKTYVHTGKEK